MKLVVFLLDELVLVLDLILNVKIEELIIELKSEYLIIIVMYNM